MRDHTAGTGSIIDDDLLTPCFCQPLTNVSRNNIARPTGRERRDDPDRLHGIMRGGRRGEVRPKCHIHGQEYAANEFTFQSDFSAHRYKTRNACASLQKVVGQLLMRCSPTPPVNRSECTARVLIR